MEPQWATKHSGNNLPPEKQSKYQCRPNSNQPVFGDSQVAAESKIGFSKLWDKSVLTEEACHDKKVFDTQISAIPKIY